MFLTHKDRIILSHWTQSALHAYHATLPYLVLALWASLFIPALCLLGALFVLAIPPVAIAYCVSPALCLTPFDRAAWLARLFGHAKSTPHTAREAVAKDTPPSGETLDCDGAEGVDLVGVELCPDEGENEGQDMSDDVGLDCPLLGVACPTILCQAEIDAAVWSQTLPPGEGGWTVRLDEIDTVTAEEWQRWKMDQITLAARQEEVERLLDLPDYRGSKGYALLRRDVKGFCGLDRLPRGDRRCLAMMLAARKYPLD